MPPEEFNSIFSFINYNSRGNRWIKTLRLKIKLILPLIDSGDSTSLSIRPSASLAATKSELFD